MTSGDVSSGLRWSGISVVCRELARLGFTIVLARAVGPEAFGIVAQALVYIGITSLLLDQGFSSALIQRPNLEQDAPGAVVTVNLVVGGALALLTVAVAPLWAGFMSTPQLTLVLTVLAVSLFIRSVSITPRAMLLRQMDYRKIGTADVVAAVSGGALGVLSAELGASYWALVIQYVTTEAALVIVLLLLGAGNRPNLRLHRLREMAGFSGRAFIAGILINSISRNIDNLLIGRFLGAEPLAFYGLAYRLLLLPVQLVSTTIGAVLFPSFSRRATDLDQVRDDLARATRVLAIVSIPAMAITAAAAPQLVLLLFGEQWQPAIPIVQVLAITGAVQAIYYSTNAPLVLGLGRADLNLRLAWLTTIVSTAGIVAGLPFGPLEVAIGYSVATALLLPVDWLVRRHLLGITVRGQIAALLPAIHTAAWAAATYVLVAAGIVDDDLVALLVGGPAALLVGALVFRLGHRSHYRELIQMALRVSGRGAPNPVPVDDTLS
ncbi:MAG: lipopolysaccharide biosynthesis protein [Pseudonocardiaceae bacterium]